MKQKLNLMFSSVDFAIVNLVRLVPYVEGFSKPIFLDIVDSIGLNYLSSRKKVSSWFWKLIYRIEIKRLLTYEKECVKSLRNTFFVNYDECKYYSKFGSTRWIPNGVNNALFSYVYKEDQYMNSVAFFGKMDYQPNIDAVLWFVNHVLGELPEMSFYIIGSNPVEKVLSLQSKFANIHVTGYLDDPYRVLNSCALVVSPMQTGGGIQNKILESMALGKVNLLTTKAASPIQGAIEGIHYLLADTPELMKAHITQVMNDRAGYEHIGENAKKLMMELYTWENYKTKLYSMLEENYI
ncbi:glycosyltransferase [Arcticibacter pallidicorallinus]|uniref:glycosyltransferase n=1 Tax=Arcticibacter pallidicorallinus TaxID=1259464 RepID=UPI0015E6F179|nr:glycosyltransferase [Arcticibacter pallidicorallinus]